MAAAWVFTSRLPAAAAARLRGWRSGQPARLHAARIAHERAAHAGEGRGPAAPRLHHLRPGRGPPPADALAPRRGARRGPARFLRVRGRLPRRSRRRPRQRRGLAGHETGRARLCGRPGHGNVAEAGRLAMTARRDVAVVVGSLRQGSFNRMMAHNLAELAPPSLKLEIVEIRELPLYDQDLDAAPPAPWTAFRERIRRADAALFVTPEYNRSVPGVLKNAVDVASRPYGHSAWDGKPSAVISVSAGALGGFAANHALRQSFVFLNMPCMPQP